MLLCNFTPFDNTILFAGKILILMVYLELILEIKIFRIFRDLEWVVELLSLSNVH